jgi:hypothetical protein
LEREEVRWGLGSAAGSAVLLGPEGELEIHGMAFYLDDADGDFQILSGPPEAADPPVAADPPTENT